MCFFKVKLNYFLPIKEETNIHRKISYLLVVFRNVLDVENPHSKGLANVVVPEHDNDKNMSVHTPHLQICNSCCVTV